MKLHRELDIFFQSEKARHSLFSICVPQDLRWPVLCFAASIDGSKIGAFLVKMTSIVDFCSLATLPHTSHMDELFTPVRPHHGVVSPQTCVQITTFLSRFRLGLFVCYLQLLHTRAELTVWAEEQCLLESQQPCS